MKNVVRGEKSAEMLELELEQANSNFTTMIVLAILGMVFVGLLASEGRETRAENKIYENIKQVCSYYEYL